MFTTENLVNFTKHIIQCNAIPKSVNKFMNKYDPNIVDDEPILNNFVCKKELHDKNIENSKDETVINKTTQKEKEKSVILNATNKHPIKIPRQIDTTYKPRQKDSLFWCFYILKNGYFNYEMEINNQYFVVEKAEKFKYIEMIRKNKDLIKLHKIKPFTELEDDLANKQKISIKTFFALCILENINVLLVDKRKIYEITCIDIDDLHPVNVIHRNSQTCEHYIELNVTKENLQKYRDTYYKMDNFDATIKAIGSYKLDELIDLCKKLDINIANDNKKKQTKKDIYELLVLNY
jgi:hypothetical protein